MRFSVPEVQVGAGLVESMKPNFLQALENSLTLLCISDWVMALSAYSTANRKSRAVPSCIMSLTEVFED